MRERGGRKREGDETVLKVRERERDSHYMHILLRADKDPIPPA